MCYSFFFSLVVFGLKISFNYFFASLENLVHQITSAVDRVADPGSARPDPIPETKNQSGSDPIDIRYPIPLCRKLDPTFSCFPSIFDTKVEFIMLTFINKCR